MATPTAPAHPRTRIQNAHGTDSSARVVRRPGSCRRPRWRSPGTPRGYDPTPPAGGPLLGRARLTPVGAPNTPVRKAFSTAWLLGRRAGRDAGWACHVLPRAGPVRPPRRVAIGRRPKGLGRGRGRPVQALRTRKTREEDGRGPAEGRRREREGERRRDSRKPAASVRVRGRGAAGEASAGLKVEAANDVRRVESLAERTSR